MEKTEIRDFTRRQTGPACARVLARLKIPFKLDEERFPIVLKTAVEAAFSMKGARHSAPNPARLEAHLNAKTKARHRAA